MRVVIAPAEDSDAAALAAIKWRREDELYAEYGTAEEHARGLREYCTPEYVHGLMDDSETVLLKAVTDQHIVGMGAVTFRDGEGWIHSLFAEVSGKRLGAQLMAKLCDEVQARGHVQVACEVFEKNAVARRFFGRLGFEDDGWRASGSYPTQRLIRMSAPVEVVQRSLTR